MFSARECELIRVVVFTVIISVNSVSILDGLKVPEFTFAFRYDFKCEQKYAQDYTKLLRPLLLIYLIFFYFVKITLFLYSSTF